MKVTITRTASILAVTSTVAVTAFVPTTTRISSSSATATTTTTKSQLYNDLWGAPPQKDGDNKDKSLALPFAPRPKLLDGTMPADVGFE